MYKRQAVLQSKSGLYRPGSPKKSKREKLAELVKDSTEKNRQFFVLYVGLLVYVMLMVLSTTDQMLLFSTQGLKLPLIDVTLPLIPFYIIAPLFLLATHFNLLQNLESHHNRLMRWRDACGKDGVPREEIIAFLFDYEWLEKGSQMECLVRFTSRILFLHSGPLALGILLWRFTDYQNIFITIFHLSVLITDSYLVWQTELAFNKNNEPTQSRPDELAHNCSLGLIIRMRGIGVFFQELRNFIIYQLNKIWRVFLWGGICTELIFACWVSICTDGFINGYLNNGWIVKFPVIRSLFVPFISIPGNATVWVPDKVNIGVQALSDEQPSSLKESIPIEGATPTEKASQAIGWQVYGAVLDLTDRNLRSLSAPHLFLPKLKLDEASDLRGADLRFTVLVGAQLQSANLERVNFSYAHLEAANLIEAKIQGAIFTGTYFSNTEVTDSQYNYLARVLTQGQLKGLKRK